MPGEARRGESVFCHRSGTHSYFPKDTSHKSQERCRRRGLSGQRMRECFCSANRFETRFRGGLNLVRVCKLIPRYTDLATRLRYIMTARKDVPFHLNIAQYAGLRGMCVNFVVRAVLIKIIISIIYTQHALRGVYCIFFVCIP